MWQKRDTPIEGRAGGGGVAGAAGVTSSMGRKEEMKDGGGR